MEETIKKIIHIDKEAEEYKKNSKKILDQTKRELEKTLLEMDNSFKIKIKNKKNEIIKEKNIQAEQVTKSIEENKNKEIKKLKELYKGKENLIVEEIFKKVISSSEEG